ncbi:MAG: UbiD family decarboxylase [Caldisphaeraceae archaeon]|nr:UbiD family decarboxylase [Caldisphaeraceae archaeon]
MVDPLKDLRSYVSWLEDNGALVRIKEPLSPILEIPTLLRQVMYLKGPAVLIENVKGFEDWKVVGNLFPDLGVLASSLSVKGLEEIGMRLINPLKSIPYTVSEKIKMIGQATKFSSYLPKKVKKASFEEKVIEGEPLSSIPFFKTWPKDGGRYGTFPIVVTKDSHNNVINMGVYRIQIISGRKAIIHWQIHKRGSMVFQDALEKKIEKIPVAIVLGTDPGTMLTSVSPVPYPMDKALFAGIVRGKGIELYELDNGIEVPANSEVVIEGYVDTKELRKEGPFGDHFGYYNEPEEMYPVFTVTRLYMRENPLYYGSVTGLPPLEDAVLGKAIERIFKPIISYIIPEVVEINYPVEGMFQGIVIVSIKKRYPGHAKKVMNALWGVGQSSLTKIIVVVDYDINPHDISKVLWAISSNVNPERDVLIIKGSHADALDPSNVFHSYNSKMGIDATRKLPEENYGKKWPEMVREDENIIKRMREIAERIIQGKNLKNSNVQKPQPPGDNH